MRRMCAYTEPAAVCTRSPTQRCPCWGERRRGAGWREVLREGTAGYEVCPLQDANDVPGSVKAVSQSALIRVTCRTRVPGDPLELVSRAPAVFVRAKSFFVGAARKLLQKLRRRLVGGVQVGDQGSSLASHAGQLGKPAANPTFVVLAKARARAVHAQPQREGAEPSECAADVRGWRRLVPGRRLTGGVAGTRTSGGGGGCELEDTHRAGNRLLLEAEAWLQSQRRVPRALHRRDQRTYL